MIRSFLGCVVAATLLLTSQPAVAELPSIRFDRLQPMGCQAGKALEISVQGRDLEEVTALRFDHPGLSATLVKPGQFQVTVSSDVPLGTYEVRLVGKYGISNPKLFYVSRGLEDVLEKDPNDTVDEAQPVPLNSAIHGSSDGNGQDVYRVNLPAGKRIVVTSLGQNLETQLDGNLLLSTASGQLLASNGDYNGRDPLLDFTAPAAGDYLITLHDLTYRGGLPYLLIVTDLPYIENVFPRAVEAGKTVEFTALGRNLGGTAGASGFEEFKFSMAIPNDYRETRRFDFLEHPTDYSSAPTAATFMLNGMQLRVPVGAGALRAQSLLVTDQPVVLEQEPNDQRDQPQKLTLPVVVSGRFEKPRDADWYEIQVPENGAYLFETDAERLSGQADPYVAVYDEQGNSQGEHDDYGPRVNAFDGHIRDAYGTFNLQEKKTYRVIVQDRYTRGGPRYQYALTIRKQRPDFDIAVIHAENPGPSGTNVWRGGTVHWDVVLQRHYGFDPGVSVTITAEGLPPGVQILPTTITNESRGTLVVIADQGATPGEYPVKLWATATVDGKTLRRPVRGYTRCFPDANPGSSVPMRDIVLGVRETAPYRLEIQPDRISGVAGQKVELKLIAHRLWPDFKDKINFIPLAFPGQFQLPNGEVRSDQTEVRIEIMLQNGTRPGDYTLGVLGQAQVPFEKDPQKMPKSNTLVSSPSRPVTITVTEPKKDEQK